MSHVAWFIPYEAYGTVDIICIKLIDHLTDCLIGDGGYPSSSEERYQPIQPRNLIRPKPITLPVDAHSGFRERKKPHDIALVKNIM